MEARHVKKWVLNHGFTAAGLNTFEAPYDGMTVRVAIGHKFVTSYLVRGQDAEILVRTRHTMIDVDNNGMINGVGLDTRFVNNIHRGGPVPCWFPLRHAAMVHQQIAEPRATRPTPMRGLKWPEIVAWAQANGFGTIHRGLFQSELGGATVSLKLLPRTLVAHISDRDGDRYLGAAKCQDLSIDPDGILRGVGLKDGFLQMVADGEEPPPWFSHRLVEFVQDMSSPEVRYGR